MADFADSKCSGCPYRFQTHLGSTRYFNGRGPLSIEHGNNGDVLLVFQAPGVVEWEVGQPLQSECNTPSSAGVRINNSWMRMGKTRGDYDITNAVQCYPGKYRSNRDKKPRKPSIRCCLEWLKLDIKKGQHKKIIAFGNVAYEQVNKALTQLGLCSEVCVICSKHPSGGVSNNSLDSLW